MSGENNTNNYETLFKIWERCIRLEFENLKFYCECMLKLSRTFFKIEQTEMLSYIKRIMSPAFPLMVNYFVNRADAYISSKLEKERVEILEDIERSIVRFWDVHESIIQSSNGADRILMQTAPIDSGVHYAVPKLCAYYSELLNTFANLLNEESKNHYAFCVYPTLNSQAEAELLFATMKQRGKVGVIRVPGKDIANVEYITALLFHEFFHIIPGGLRLRKKRALFFLNILLYDIDALLIGDLKFEDDKSKEKLREYLFGKLCGTILEELRKHEKGDRLFYSENIKEYYANEFIRQLRHLNDRSFLDMMEGLYPQYQFMDYTEYVQKREPVKKWYSQIKMNISRVCISGVIEKRCSFYMGVFREAYADLLTVISLNLLPEKYFSVFHYKGTNIDKNYRRIGLFLRAFFVKEVMCGKEEKETFYWKDKLFKTWTDWGIKMDGQIVRDGLREGVKDMTRLFYSKDGFCSHIKLEGEDSYVIQSIDEEMVPNKAILEKYLLYFRTCRDQYLQYLDRSEKKFKEIEQQFGISSSNPAIHCISFREWEQT